MFIVSIDTYTQQRREGERKQSLGLSFANLEFFSRENVGVTAPEVKDRRSKPTQRDAYEKVATAKNIRIEKRKQWTRLSIKKPYQEREKEGWTMRKVYR